MNSETIKSLFERSRDQYDSALRWSHIILILILFFHLMIFSPYVSTSKQQDSFAKGLNKQKALIKQIETVRHDLETIHNITNDKLKPRLENFVESLRCTLFLTWIGIAIIELRKWDEIADQLLLFYFLVSFLVILISHILLWKTQNSYFSLFPKN